MNTIQQDFYIPDLVKQLKSKPGKASDVADKIILFRKLIELGAVHTLEPLLEILLRLKGKPYSLADHFPFSPLFRTRMAKQLTCKAGRQVAKTSSTAANSICVANSIPYFATLFVTPLYEQVRKISTNYVRPFIDESPVKALWTNTSTENSVLQRSFTNQSKLYFSFALLDADRVRGISADRIIFDESVRGDNTYVDTKESGRILLKDVKVGQYVASFMNNGDVVWKKVSKNSYHGFRRCYRLITESGKYVDLTSESFVATSSGWLRVSQIIEIVKSGAAIKISNDDSARMGTIDATTEVSNPGNTSGRRMHFKKRAIRSQTRTEPGGIYLDEIHNLIRVRSRNTFDFEEEQTRLRVNSLLDTNGSGIQILASSVLSEQQENYNHRLVKSDRKGRIFRNRCLVDSRRRDTSTQNEYVPQLDGMYKWIYPIRSRTSERLAGKSWVSRKYLYLKTEERLSDVNLSSEPVNRFDDKTNSVYSPKHVIQIKYWRSSGDGNLYILQAAIYSKQLQQEISKKDADSKLYKSEMFIGKEKVCTTALTKENLTTIIDVGEHDVYDIEVEDTHTFIANGLALSNCQDIDIDHVPIIKEVMSHSKWGITWCMGTPKTEDNALERVFWRESSQAEWFIKCPACNKWNIPSKDYDIIEMIGPLRDDIGIHSPATVCAKCKKPIDPRTGRWVHRFKERRWKNVGYHIPQIIMPIHYADHDKWADLLAKQRGAGNTTVAQFYNEVLGESYDQSTKLITESELRAASDLPWTNDPYNFESQIKLINNYSLRCLAVDWGGGGEKETSFTTLAVIGYKPNGGLDVIWGRRLLTPYEHIGEAEYCLKIFNAFKCHFFVHDYTGAGALRETFINQAGVPASKIIPVALCRSAARDIISLHAASRTHPRDFYNLDKARSLQLTCNAIKLKFIRFFKYDYVNSDDEGLINDFLALIEDYTDSTVGKLYKIIRNPTAKDDFAQAVNIGAAALWHTTGNWPNLPELRSLQLSVEQLNHINPPHDKTWIDDTDLEPNKGAMRKPN